MHETRTPTSPTAQSRQGNGNQDDLPVTSSSQTPICSESGPDDPQENVTSTTENFGPTLSTAFKPGFNEGLPGASEDESFGTLTARAMRLGRHKRQWRTMTDEERAVFEQVDADERRRQLLDAWLSPQDDDDGDVLRGSQYDPFPPSDIPLIRIIQLLPGTGWEPIHVVFDVTAVDSVEYEALSYTWGDATQRSSITCNGRRVNVTRNLKSALRDLRRPDTPRRLWVDAICINQDDLDEREAQVKIMRTIYSSAEATVAWLGETFLGVEIAFRMLRRMYEVHYKRLEDDDFDFHTLMFTDKDVPERATGTEPTNHEMRAFCELVDRPYFRRCWIVQEIALGPKVIVKCGAEEMDWSEFHGAVLMCCILGSRGVTGTMTSFGPLFTLNSIRAGAQADTDSDVLTLSRLLEAVRLAQATDARDKIYSLLGLTITDVDEYGVVPNYRIAIEEAYTQVAKALLLSCDTLDLFHLARGESELSRRLPSWVLDWSDTTEQAQSFFDRDESGSDVYPVRPFNASGVSTLPVPLFLPGDRLQLRGLRLDNVTRLGKFLPDSVVTFDEAQRRTRSLDQQVGGFREALKGLGGLYAWAYRSIALDKGQADIMVQWHEMILGPREEAAKSMYGPTGESREIAYVRTLCGDYMPSGLDDAMESFQAWKGTQKQAAMLRKVKLNKIPALHNFVNVASTFIPSSKSQVRQAFHMLLGNALKRRIAWTERGFLGLMPDFARLNDEVWLVQGSRLPLILRRIENSADYERVGSCYVHGAMYGEYFSQGECQNLVLA